MAANVLEESDTLALFKQLVKVAEVPGVLAHRCERQFRTDRPNDLPIVASI